MALPPQFSSRVPTGTVQQAPRRIEVSRVPRSLGLLGRAGQQADQVQQNADNQVAASEARIREAAARRDRQAEILRQGVRLTEIEAAASRDIAALEREPAMFGEGHAAKVSEVLTERRATYVEGLPRDEEIRAKAIAQWDAWASRAGVRAEVFEAGQRVKDQEQAWERQGSQTAAMLYDDPTPEHFVALMDQDAAWLQNMDIPESGKEAMYAERGNERALALLSGLIERGAYDEVDALRKSDVMKPFLEYRDSQRFKGLADNGRAMLAREAEMRQDAARDAVRSQIDNTEELIKQGVTELDVPIESLLASADAARLEPVEITKLQGLALGLKVNQRYQSTGELTSHVRQMDTMERAGKLDQAGQRTLFFMRQRLDRLSREKAAEFEQGWDAGGKERGKAVAAMMALPLAERVSAASALDANGTLRYAVQLPSGTALTAVRGSEIRAADKTLLPTGRAEMREVRASFDAITGDLFAGLNVETREAMFDMSLDVLAWHMDHRGVRAYDDDMLRGAISMVLGRQRDPATGRVGGGLGSWNDAPVWLPPRSDQTSFEAELRAAPFEDAAEPKAVILENYRPRAVRENASGNTLYQFVDDAGELLGRASGTGPFEMWMGS